MKQHLLSTPHFALQRKEIPAHDVCEQIGRDNIFFQKIAHPLFAVGLRIAGITERPHYASAPVQGSPGRPWHVFTLLLQGRMDITLNQARQIIEPGQLVCAPAGTPFRRVGLGPTWWLYFDFSDIAPWTSLKDNGAYIRDYEHPMLLFSLLRSILDAQSKGTLHAHTLAVEGAHLLVQLLSHEIAIGGKHVPPHAQELDALMAEITRRPQDSWSIREMARLAALSKSHLSALFKQHYGVSPMDAVIRQHMLRAIDLLTLNRMSVQETAFAVGYKSVCSFSRLFTRHVGISPNAYRAARA